MITASKSQLERYIPRLFIGAGLLGLLAAFQITVDHMHQLSDPNFVPACSINPVISCGTIMNSHQASAFGFSNTLLGLMGFAALVAVGVGLLAGARYARWFWRGLYAGITGGIVFIHWLMYQAIFSIHALCLWCILCWIIMIPLYLYTSLYVVGAGYVAVPKPVAAAISSLRRYHFVYLGLWYFVITATVISQFWASYFHTIL